MLRFLYLRTEAFERNSIILLVRGKFDYLDYNFIFKKDPLTQFKEKILKHPINKLFFQSNKKILDEGKIYPSVASIKAGQTCESLTDKTFFPLVDTEEFWNDLEDMSEEKK